MKMRHTQSRPANVRNRLVNRQRALGMTLLELMVVIVLIGTVLAILGSKIVGNKQRAEYKLAQTQLNTLSQKVESYQSDVGNLPDSLDQLVTPPSNATGWLGPYAKVTEFKDPWQHLIEYRHPGDNNEPYQLISLGVDGKPGGEGIDKDLTAP
jgi:general secretion pathway protein G